MDYWSGDSTQSDLWILLTAVETCSSAICASHLCQCKGELILIEQKIQQTAAMQTEVILGVFYTP